MTDKLLRRIGAIEAPWDNDILLAVPRDVAAPADFMAVGLDVQAMVLAMLTLKEEFRVYK